MNKRQKKKKQKKYLPIIADEFNLITMTEEEREKAFKDYKKFRERFAYRKRYKDLKNGEPLFYYFPVGQQHRNAMIELSNITKKVRKTTTTTITQSLNDFK